MNSKEIEHEVEELEERLEKTEGKLKEVEEGEKTVGKKLDKLSRGQFGILRKLRLLLPTRFKVKDTVQQIVGAWAILVPLTHFSEIMAIPHHMPTIRIVFHMILTFGLALMITVKNESKESKKKRFLGIPISFISLFFVCVLSTLALMFLYVENLEYHFRTFFFLLGFSFVAAATGDALG